MTKKKTGKRHIGVLRKHQRGFGFVECEDMEDDIFISASSMHSAMDGDRVEVDLIPEYLWEKSAEGIITKIVERKVTEVVGTFEKSNKFGFVVPEGKGGEDVFIRKEFFSGAQHGDKVVAEITKYPVGKSSAEGWIKEIISRAGQPGGDIKAIARTYDMRETFPSRVNAEAKAMKKQGIRPQDIEGRRDLRGKRIFTIDGADSKDFDDAVSIAILPNGNYLLGVHIADVTHYVEESGYLDKEALKRGTSVYLIDQVIPMLPKALSNDICSLNPDVDRLTLSVDMEISSNGDIINHDIYESIIRSKYRLVYDDISDLIENNDKAVADRYFEIKDDLLAMARLASILNGKRSERGSIDFDLDEAYITLDERGIPVDIGIATRRSANKMIEEFMLLANEVVAEHFYWMEIPFIYRVHEKPEITKLETLRMFLGSLGINIKGSLDNIHPRTIREVLEQAAGMPHENVVSSVTLRSMQKAYYSTQCEGHFGLALKYYCHFTSPIRRYPDLMIHRIIKKSLKGKISQEDISALTAAADNAAQLSSTAERQAIEAEREVEKLKKTEYMEGFVDEEFRGIISGVTNFGIYVQLENTCEGLVRTEDIEDDYYQFIPEKYALIGENTNRVFKLGDEVDVIVYNVSVERREVDFLLAEFE